MTSVKQTNENAAQVTIRRLLFPFLYDHIERFAALVDEGGDDATLEGVRLVDDKAAFAKEQLADVSVALYIHYRKTGDPRASVAKERLLRLLDRIRSIHCETWGKIALLRACDRLQKAGLWNDLPAEYLDMIREKTTYDDFFDRRTMTLIHKPTNYLQVAMTCAGYREKFGWDEAGMCDRIAETLFSVMKDGSSSGYMDEEPPYGRFDRYSLLVGSEMSDNLMELGRKMPEFAKNNLQKAAEFCLFSANRRGDGINYGRSLSCHGDGASAEILSSALARGYLPENSEGTALAYILRVVEKILTVWYDQKRGMFNIWLDGRATNGYRGIVRLLEVNADMAVHLLTVFHNLEIAGLADTAPTAVIPSPAKWQVKEEVFLDTPDRHLETVLLRRGDLSLMLPLVGPGSWYDKTAYQPFPTLCGVLEAAPEATYPYFVPEYTVADGRRLRPVQYFRRVEVSAEDDAVTVLAEGTLAVMGGRTPTDSGIPFRTVYTFRDTTVSARFTTEAVGTAVMVTGRLAATGDIAVYGFDRAETLDTAGAEYHALTGPIVTATRHTADLAAECGYTVSLA